ncbi:LON peptidase N-terminal domain and RING finger protein 3-like [Stylophora pistillata]|uniref:LON peptidase N-terminal domain and RING finger protein 3 n=1 Tax=Stylophora pistillata TaxID=50429 RepID=A0A2B4RSY8_STYPI|nr:LON peptidase N-terminal domain and RING finger protein 3-like [Stylophora pistillata]PFX19342.1 LON peptidase N-terminal domain and RING finger protein 3 [Stylophora pistillata]
MEKKTREQCDLRSKEWKLTKKLHADTRDLSCRVAAKVPGAESVISIANKLVDFQRQIVAQEKAFNGVNEREEKEFLCSLCGCFYIGPVTLNCGHTLCKTCIVPVGEISISAVYCKLCGSKNHENNLSVNVLVSQLIQKWFPREYQREVKHLEKAIQGELQDNHQKIVESLSDVLNKSPKHVMALKLRSHAFLQMGLPKKALEDVDLACDLRPFLWSVFHHRGLVLMAMGDYHRAASSLSRAVALDPNVDPAQFQSELLTCLTHTLDSERVDPSRELFPEQYFRDLNRDKARQSLHADKANNQSPRESFLEKRSSLKRPIEDTSDSCSLCSREWGSKYFKSATELILNSTDLCEANAVKELEDLECKVCYNILYQPVTTTCGHTFCRTCLHRGLDYRSECPYCRRALNCGVERNIKINVIIKETVEKLFPDEYAEREKSFMKEKSRWEGAGVNEDIEVPVFVCLLAFPSLKYPLYIFEPRYQLMIRRCVELGSRMFGMCANSEDPGKEFSDYGTILLIENVRFLPDGRSIVETTAMRRFRVVSRSTTDGYSTAKVKWLEDELPRLYSEDPDLQTMNVDCYRALELWLNLLTPLQQTCVTNAIGSMPPVEELVPSSNGPSWLWWGLAAVPLKDEAKLIILSMTSLAERLQSLHRFLELLIGVRNEN